MKKLGPLMMLALLSCGTPGNNTGTGGGSATNSQTCRQDHECINGSCTCKSGPKSGDACAETACATYCRWCQ